ncbi:hypothetical protein AB0I81_62770 [Nonomuraea sp. NPDC050404]|uniref:hypothetical protein n=1 Tax=Nonomuraea sp. NPDC050404 TaxID=3155783 RepID=UPI00340F9A6B
MNSYVKLVFSSGLIILALYVTALISFRRPPDHGIRVPRVVTALLRRRDPRNLRQAHPDDGDHATRRVPATVLLPWRTAKFLFKPRVGPSHMDRTLDRLTFWRAVVGTAVILAATLPYRDVVAGMSDLGLKMAKTGGLAFVLLPLQILVMLIVTRAGHRLHLRPGVLLLMGRLALALAVYLLMVAAGGLIFGFLDNRTVSLDIGLVLIVLFLWFGCFWGCTVYWAVRTGFWTGDVHPLLAPIATTGVMLLISGQELIEHNTNDVPDWLWLTLNLCGTATALVLAVVEYRHLRSIGYRLRNGPESPATATGGQTDRPDVGQQLANPDHRVDVQAGTPGHGPLSTRLSVGASTGWKISTIVFALVCAAFLGFFVGGGMVGTGTAPTEFPPLIAALLVAWPLFVVIFMVTRTLRAFRYAAWLEGTTLSVRGAYRTRRVDLSRVTSWTYRAAFQAEGAENADQSRRVPVLVVEGDRGRRLLELRLHNGRGAVLPPHELTALADAVAEGPAADSLRRWAADPSLHLG